MTKLHVAEKLSLPLDAVTSTLVVYGGKGMGKTNFGRRFAEEIARAHRRFAVIDPVGVWWGLQISADGKGGGLDDVVILGGTHGDIPIEPTSGAVVADFVADEDAVSVVVDISRRANGTMWSLGERFRFVTEYATRLFERQGERRRPLMQIIDEAGRLVPQVIPHGSPNVAACVGAIERLVEEGRNVGIGVCLITQRSARMNKSVSELADAMIAFRTIGPRSIEAIVDWLGEHVSKDKWKAHVESLRALPRGDALVVSPGWLEHEGVVTTLLAWTFDSSATPTGTEKRATGKAAKPDLAKYEARMRETIERAKLDDPKALRARVAQLEKELSTRSPSLPLARPDEVSKFVKQIVEVPLFTKDDERALAKTVIALERLREQAAALTERATAVTDGVEKRVEIIRKDVEAMQTKLLVWKRDAASAEIPETRQRTSPPPVPRATHAAPAHTNGASAHNDASNPIKLNPGERAILIACGQTTRGATSPQIGVLTSYKSTSRRVYLQHLTQLGLLRLAGDRYVITDKGVDTLADDYRQLPTGSELRVYQLANLPQGERKIFTLLCDEYPNAVTNVAIAEACTFKETSVRVYLQKLKARELAIDAGRGAAVAEKTLFS